VLQNTQDNNAMWGSVLCRPMRPMPLPHGTSAIELRLAMQAESLKQATHRRVGCVCALGPQCSDRRLAGATALQKISHVKCQRRGCSSYCATSDRASVA
jgi:hypothetical protein